MPRNTGNVAHRNKTTSGERLNSTTRCFQKEKKVHVHVTHHILIRHPISELVWQGL